MKNHYNILTVVCALVLSTTLVAQGPTIDLVNMPQINDVTPIAICSGDVVAPGNSGADQTWDMSGLAETEEQAFLFEAPENTFFSNDFPNADVCGISWDPAYSYYNYSPDSLTILGYATLLEQLDPTDTVKQFYSNPESYVPLPFSFGDVHSDFFAGTSVTPLLDLPFEGTTDFEADGYGTLVLPTGTFNDVVRFRIDREQTSSGPTQITQTKEQYVWVSATHRFWLLVMETYNDGFSTSELIWYNKNPAPITTGIDDNRVAAVNVYPNPISAAGNLAIQWDSNEMVEAVVTSVAGEELLRTQLNLSQGMNPLDLSAIDMRTGMYLLHIHSERGVGIAKLLVR